MRIIASLLIAGLCYGPVMGQTNALTGKTDSISYSLGIVFGSTMANAGIKEVNDQVFMQGIQDAIGEKRPIISIEQANMILNAYVTELNEKKAMDNLIEGQKFLDENAKKEGVVTLPSGLQYKVITAGSGTSPVDTSMVTVHYTGTYADGKVFDSSVERGEPATFPVNGVIPGWTEALKLMKPGDKWIIYLPADLAYGEQGTRGIEPNSVLVFEVELISVE